MQSLLSSYLSIYQCILLWTNLLHLVGILLEHLYIFFPNVSEFVQHTTYNSFRYILSGSHSNGPTFCGSYFLYNYGKMTKKNNSKGGKLHFCLISAEYAECGCLASCTVQNTLIVGSDGIKVDTKRVHSKV